MIENVTYTEASHNLPEGFTVRPARQDDLIPLTELINTCSLVDLGAPVQTEEELLRDWESPGFDRDLDSCVVLAPDGQIVGYAEFWNLTTPPVKPFLYFIAHPDHRTGDVERYMLHWGEARTIECLPSMPPEARVTLRCGTVSNRSDLKALFVSEGYAFVRTFLRMRIEMETPPPDPVWPEGFTVRTIRDMEDDLYAAYLVDQEAFQDHWGFMPISFDTVKHWFENDPDFDLSLHFLAVTVGPNGEEIVGICFCRPQTTEDPAMGWVKDLAVRRPWRRLGIAQALLYHCFGEFWRRGQHKVGLGVDASSLTGATRLYEKVGMHAYRQYDSYEKELRSGVELSTQELEDQP